ncbi:hypothetical protein BDV98DRAFT_582438 [Pterulicium gracile]|uniref:tripeptidyl-peptidase II n=1 Tax=Pterulicium gracile TaxID=1884261 RepID=A0A5C3QNM0_9AGAR|nr:hypothetical protein BDV98DRAFT_582438 [Pterula gracilis]
MISTRFTLLAVLILAALANPLLGDAHQRRTDLPEGFTTAGSAPQDETITLRIALAQRDFPGLEKALYAASMPGSPQYGQYLTTVGQANRLLQAEFTRYVAEGMDDPVVRTLSYTIPNMVKDYVATVHPTTASLRFPPLANQRTRVVKDAAGNKVSADLSPRTESNSIPPSCIAGPEDDPIAFNKPKSFPCRFDLYGIPYTTVGTPVLDNSLWISGYANEFANRNRTKEYLRLWRPDLVDREMFRLVTIAGGLNNQLPSGAGLFPTAAVSTALSTVANTPVTFMSVGTENSDDAIAWLIEQANYLLELENPPKVLVGDYPMSEFLVDAALARFVPPNDGAEDLANLAARGVAIVFPVESHGVGISSSTWAGSACPKFYTSFPASCPYLTAVGSSSILEDGTFEDVSRYNSGGFSDYFPRPAYQDAAIADYLQVLDGAYEGMYNPAGRATPDVSVHEYQQIPPGLGDFFASESFAATFSVASWRYSTRN